MIESDLVSEVLLDKNCYPRGLRIGSSEYAIWGDAGGIRSKCRVDDLVIKFDHEPGTGQTYKEALLSSKIQIPDRKYFVEVLHFGTAKDSRGSEWAWAAQRFIDVVAKIPAIDRATIDKCYTKLRELCARYRISDIGAFGHNWTIFNADPLIYDYGFGEGGNQMFKKT